MASAAEPVRYFDRYTGRLEREQIYGEAWLRWAYETTPGRLALWALVKRAWFSRLYGWLMRRPSSREKVVPFVARYGLDVSEFATAVDAFDSFDDFFVRRLRPEVRPIDPDPDSVVFPADGRHLGFPRAADVGLLALKGERANLEELLGDAGLATRFAEGPLLVSRLCPVDYHRFHFPAAGTPGAPERLPGPLHSVNPIALARRAGILVRNRRVVTLLETPRFGSVAIVEVGATNVGSIVQTFAPGREVAKGEEKGYFQFGGSAMLTLFEPGRVTLAADLLEHSAAGHELYAHMGDAAGRRT